MPTDLPDASPVDTSPVVIARAESERGELLVRKRRDGALELRVNGVFVMDTVETSSEVRLAQEALTEAGDPHRVLVGGLGLGHTVRGLLADDRVRHVVVVEIEPAVVGWMEQGVLPGAELLSDPRVEVVVGDVREVVPTLPAAGFDAVLLDVDNGPGYLVHDRNAAIYAAPFLEQCRRLLRAEGRLSVWSAADAPTLAETITDVFGECRTRAVPVDLQGRAEQYWLLGAGR